MILGLKAPEGAYHFTLISSMTLCGTRGHRTVIVALPANETRNMPTLTNTIFIVEDFHNTLLFGIDPRNKIPWAERLMASTALTGRTIVEFFLPGISWYLNECVAYKNFGGVFFKRVIKKIFIVRCS